MDKLLIIDGNSIANRAYYALPFLSNHEGKPTGAVFGFANILIKVLNETKPSHVVVAFDHARKTFRNEIYSEYKMQRKPSPDELIVQFPVIKQMLNIMDIEVIEKAGIEADDIIGSVCKKFNGEKFILSGDRDLLQLIDENTCVWLTKKGVSEVDRVDIERLKELFNLSPSQIIDLKALMGDSSDNIPGVSGVGEKTALSLLEKYTNIDGVYAHIDEIKGKLKENLVADKDKAYMSKQLATIKCDCDIDFDLDKAKLNMPFDEKVYNFFKEQDFSSLLKNENLFKDNFQTSTKSKKIDRVKLTSDILNKLADYKLEYFCYDFEKLEFFIDGKVFFLEQNYGMFENEASLEIVLQKLKPLFEDKNITKITNNAKNDLHLLYRNNIALNNFFDLSIANYIINAGLKIKTLQPELDEYKDLFDEYKKFLKENQLDFVFYNIELPLTKILMEMEESGFKINKEKLEILDREFCDMIDEISAQIYLEAGEEFNINSPKQVAHILFDKLGIKTYNNRKQSTSVHKLDEYRYIPIINNILNYRKLAKIKNTYIDVYKDITASSGDIIHTTFNQTLTNTGRLSSSEPNLQNIPTRDDIGKNLRKIFVSKFKNGKIISADYNQIELRLLADMSGEEGLINSYKEGEDIHAITASHIFNVPIDQVNDIQRREAKAVNFGIIYGISDYGLSQNIKSTREQAKQYIDSYFNRYPKVKMFMDNNIAFAQKNGFAITKFGRKRKIPELESSSYFTRMFGQRVAMNMPLQGTASDIIKLAMIKVNDALKSKKLKSQLILQIHDELIIDCSPDEIDVVCEILKKEMESVTQLKVPLVVNVGIGDSLFECK